MRTSGLQLPSLKERGATLGSEINNSKTGLALSMIMDGTSKTFSLAEIREATQSAWIDGSRAWVTAAIVVHGYADGHVGQVGSEIDTNLYFPLYTGADGEAVAATPCAPAAHASRGMLHDLHHDKSPCMGRP